MFSSLALVQAFLKHPVGIIVTILVAVLIGFATFEHHENTALTAQIATLNQQLGAVNTNDAQWQATADACSKATAAVVASEAQATVNATSAVAAVQPTVQSKQTFAKQIMAQKPASSDDYTAAKALMGQLIDQRQQEITQRTQ